MPIEWDPREQQWHLSNGRLSVILSVLENGALGQSYLGPALVTGRDYRHLARGPFRGYDNRVGDPVRFELPTPDSGDYRLPALAVRHADGSQVLDLRYAAHRITAGKPELPGLPSTYVEDPGEADTLEVDLLDSISGLMATVRLSVFRDHAAIARSITVRNDGTTSVRITTLMSASLDLLDGDWELITLHGAWSRERHVVRAPIIPGRRVTESLRGSSSLEQSPFLTLVRPSTTEDAGEAIGMSLVYSGDFLADAQLDLYSTVRLRLGLHPDSFEWLLEPGAAFTSPEAVTVHSLAGLGGMSDTFHRLFRTRLARGEWRDRPRPVLLNNWEGTYFDFDEERLVGIATVARDLGVELFVLDDGWFGVRDSDDRSLGDWVVNHRKLPNGLEGLVERVTALGIDFGIWIEPKKMVNANSDLFRAHPDWAIGVPGRKRTESRQQLVLDMGRQEVVDYLFDALEAALGSARISYVKWDMNRTMTETYGLGLPPDRQGEMRHRYILGLYQLYSRLIARFPGILFESCASGGGRFDAGMLAYAPQAWTSDDTDAMERLRIQWGTSLAFPVSSMGAHVSAVPNHQVARITPLATRASVAFFGAFGYELDPVVMGAEERAQVAAQVAWFKAHRDTIQFGRFLRLRSPFEGDGNDTAWMCVTDDARHAVVGWYRELSRAVPGPRSIPLRGLNPAARYRVRVWPEADDVLVRRNTHERGGDELMSAGLFLDDVARESALRGDFQGRLFELEAI